MSGGTALSYPDPPLSDPVVRLRRWEATDLGCVREASQDPVIPAGTTVPTVYTEPAGQAWIERQWGRAESGEGLSLAVTDAATDEALGAIVLLGRTGWVAPAVSTPATPAVAAPASAPAAPVGSGSVSLGYWVLARARRRGLASRAVGLLSGWALRTADLARVEALVEPENSASQRVLERAGFQLEGRLRSYLVFAHGRADAFMYSLLRTDLDGNR